MKGYIFVLALFAFVSSTAQQNDLEGTWSGEIASAFGTIDLHIALKQKNSQLRGHLSSRKTGASRLKLDSVHYANDKLYFEIRSAQASYTGSLIESKIIGTWTQGAFNVPLTLVPSGEYEPSVTFTERRQTPQPPFDYITREITFKNPYESVELAGTLTIPKTGGPHRAVVLLSVAGPNDRDETHSGGHKPFMVLADHLTRNGIAVLRFDDRGTGFSEGDLYQTSFEDMTNDALAAIDFLRSIETIDSNTIGIIGHSEGTVIGPMAALKSKDKVSFLVMLGPTGVPLIDLTEDRSKVAWVDRGLSEDQKQELLSYMRQVTAILHENKGDEESYRRIAALKAEKTLDTPGFPAQQFMVPKDRDERIKMFISPWYRSQATYNPKDYLTQLEIPVLSITGSLDKSQTPELNIPPIRKYLTEAPIEDFTIVEVPAINHLMQTAKTGLPTEYSALEETFSPGILEMISEWILTRN